MKLTEQQLEEYKADLEYDDLMSSGYRSVGEKTFEDEQEWFNNHPREGRWGSITDKLIKEL